MKYPDWRQGVKVTCNVMLLGLPRLQKGVNMRRPTCFHELLSNMSSFTCILPAFHPESPFSGGSGKTCKSYLEGVDRKCRECREKTCQSDTVQIASAHGGHVLKWCEQRVLIQGAAYRNWAAPGHFGLPSTLLRAVSTVMQYVSR